MGIWGGSREPPKNGQKPPWQSVRELLQGDHAALPKPANLYSTKYGPFWAYLGPPPGPPPSGTLTVVADPHFSCTRVRTRVFTPVRPPRDLRGRSPYELTRSWYMHHRDAAVPLQGYARFWLIKSFSIYSLRRCSSLEPPENDIRLQRFALRYWAKGDKPLQERTARLRRPGMFLPST